VEAALRFPALPIEGSAPEPPDVALVESAPGA
jgi:hypothetical protein